MRARAKRMEERFLAVRKKCEVDMEIVEIDKHIARAETRIKAYRRLMGLSQVELAEKANVPLRTLQQYEQRQKNINKAQAEYVIRLADSLNCHPADLLENG